MVRICIALFSVFYILPTNAQIFEYDISDRSDLDRSYVFQQYLVSKADNHYIYFSNEDGIAIQRFNSDFSEVFTDEIMTESKDVDHLVLKYNFGQFAWFTVRNNFKKKQFEYEITTLDLDGNFGKTKKIVDMRYKSEKRLPIPSFKFSEDSSKMIMVLEIDFERTDDYSAYVAVFDAQFEKINEIDFIPKVSQRQLDTYNWEVANDGKVYLASIIYDDDSKDNHKRVKGKHIQAYQSMVYQFSGGLSKKEIELTKKDKFIKKSNVTAGRNSQALITYAYGYRTDDPIEGFVYSLRDTATFDEVSNDELVFTDRNLEGYSSLEYISNSRGIGIRPTFDFYASKVSDDGSYDVMMDYHYFVVTRNNFGNPGSFNNIPGNNFQTTTFYDASIFLMRIDANGQLIRSTIVPRRFGSSFVDNTGGSIVTNDASSLLFYNDSEFNLDDDVNNPSRNVRVTSSSRSNFVMADINSQNEIMRSVVFNFRAEELVLIPRSIRQISKDKYFFAAFDLKAINNRLKFGLFDVMSE